MQISLFLGSGASVPYGKPVTKQFRDDLLRKYSSSTTDDKITHLQNILKFEKFQDIEHVLQCTKEIRDFYRNSFYGAVYLAHLDPNYKIVGQIERKLNYLINSMNNVALIIENEVFATYAWNHDKDKELLNLDIFVEFLKHYSSSIDIYTTNYDKAVEEYCANNGYVCSDGFEYNFVNRRHLWSNKFDSSNNNYPYINLFKLHGSLNWKRHRMYGIERTVEESRLHDVNYVESMLIYPYLSPKEGKTNEPYNLILEQFIQRSKKIDVLIVIGFSFRDEDINDIIRGLMEQNKYVVFISPTVNRDLQDNFFKKNEFDTVKMNLQDGGSYSIINNHNNLISIEMGISLENNEEIISIIKAALETFHVEFKEGS